MSRNVSVVPGTQPEVSATEHAPPPGGGGGGGVEQLLVDASTVERVERLFAASYASTPNV